MTYTRQKDPVASGVKYSILNNSTIGLPPESSGFRKTGSFVVNMDGTEVYRSNGQRLSIKKDKKGNLVVDVPSKIPVYMASLVYRAFSGDQTPCYFRRLVFIDGNRSNCSITNLSRSKGRRKSPVAPKPKPKQVPRAVSNTRIWQREAAIKMLNDSSEFITPSEAMGVLTKYAKTSKAGDIVPEKYNDYLRVLYVSGMSIKEIAIICKTRQGNVWEVVK